MARVNNLSNFLTDVASAIKTKKGSQTAIPATNFDTEILALPSQGVYQTKVITINENGQTVITPDSGYDAMDGVQVTTLVPEKQLQTKTYNFTQNTNIQLLPDSGYDGFDTVTLNINVPGSTINNQDKTITQNGSYTADQGYTGLGTVTVNVPSGSGDVKLFDTVEHMQADSTAHEGDLAVVYREEIQPVTEESEFDSCIFPNEVVLDSAFSGDIYGRFRAVDPSVMFDGMVDMSLSRFRFTGYGESSQVRVEYESQDGITYTRTDGGEELQEFGTTIKWEDHGDPFNSVIGNFMKIGGNYFEGLFEYSKVNTNNQLTINPLSLNISDTTINLVQAGPILNYEILKSAAKYLSQFYTGDEFQFDAYIDYDNKVHIIYAKSGYNSFTRVFVVNKSNPEIYMGRPSGSTVAEHFDAIYDDVEKTFKNEQSITFTTMFKNISSSGFNCVKINGYPICAIGIQRYNYDKWRHFNSTIYYLDTIDSSTNINITDSNLKLNEMITKYILTSTQLDATSDCVYETTFYGKNGVENGTLTTGVSNSFTDVNAEVYAKIQAQYNNIQPRILTDQDKDIDSDIRIIPSKTDGTPLLDTSNVTDMHNMFGDCKKLVIVPLLDTSNVTNMQYMFGGCSNLTSIPLLDTSNVTNMNSMFSWCTSLTTIPLLDTSNVTNMPYMFNACSSLTTIPLLDTSNVTSMSNMFGGCSSLNNESLNNILAMCANAAKITSNKTLKYIRLTEEQANICKTLSNYSAFIAAGWTTGY